MARIILVPPREIPPSVPLVVPEVNGSVLDDLEGAGVIANPNCSTIIALMAVAPIHRAAGIRRMSIATYQAVSGAGGSAMDELERQAREHAAGEPLRIPLGLSMLRGMRLPALPE